MSKEEFGILKYNNTMNIGDYIQSHAASQFLPSIDYRMYRDSIGSYEHNCKIIMNGWFSYNPKNFVNKHIKPLFISFHIADFNHSKIIIPQYKDYLNKYGPIGCRDESTKDLLSSNGIEAYFSSDLCLTLPINNGTRTDEILVVEIPNKTLGKIPKEIIKKSKYINYHCPSDDKEAMIRASTLLSNYRSAKLVITSRLHVVMPCIAFGTPVIYIGENSKRTEVIGKYIPMFESYLEDTDWNGYTKDVNKERKFLSEKCESFINEEARYI